MARPRARIRAWSFLSEKASEHLSKKEANLEGSGGCLVIDLEKALIWLLLAAPDPNRYILPCSEIKGEQNLGSTGVREQVRD